MPLLDGFDGTAVKLAADRLVAGELVAFPTETVYGLGARADDEAAVSAIFAAKGRPADHPLIVHVATRQAVTEFATETGAAGELMSHFWPGPLTLILPRRPGRGAAAAGGQASIGLRMPSHPVALALLREASLRGVGGVAAPSANRFGRVSPTTAVHVVLEFGPGLTVLDGGDCEVGIESAIVDCTGARPALLRPGVLDRRRLEEVLGQPLAEPDAWSPRASGTLAAHYAPAAKVVLLDAAALGDALAGRRPPRLGVYSMIEPPARTDVWYRAMPASAAGTAHELFAVLRDFDARGVSQIWVETPPPAPEWDGVRDRLQRAAAA